jgi:hypothetical protein
MLTKPSPVIVKEGECTSCAVPTKQVHHRDFPEIWAEAGTAIEGLAHLAKRMSSARESARTEWQRGLIEHAITDIAEFIETLADKQSADEAKCRCGVRGPVTSASPLLEKSAARTRKSRVGQKSQPAAKRPSIRGKA